jgi:hypothetical protein
VRISVVFFPFFLYGGRIILYIQKGTACYQRNINLRAFDAHTKFALHC